MVLDTVEREVKRKHLDKQKTNSELNRALG